MNFRWAILLSCLTPVYGLELKADSLPNVRTVFVIVLENTTWAKVKSDPAAPYINGTLLPLGAHCEQYYTPTNNHPSLPNYLWLEAGTNFSILDDGNPSTNHINSTNHLVSQLRAAGISWRAYEEDIDGTYVPLFNTNYYAVRHDPFVYFDDVTGTNDPQNTYAIAHIRPYRELAADLANKSVAQYNFITPNVIHDGHDGLSLTNDPTAQVDDWLATNVPPILQSAAYTNNGAVFIVWDEGNADADGPIGLILLSPLVRSPGYVSSIRHTHSATVRTLQEVFRVQPWLGDAGNCADLSELFLTYGFTSVIRLSETQVQLTLAGVTPGETHVVQVSDNLTDWVDIATNVATSNQLIYTLALTNKAQSFCRCYRSP